MNLFEIFREFSFTQIIQNDHGYVSLNIDITYTLLYERQIPQKEKSLVFSGNTNLTNKFYRFFPGINFVIDP